MRKTLLVLSQMTLAGILLVTAAAGVLSLLSDRPFIATLSLTYFYAGVLLRVASVLVGSGFSEARYYGDRLVAASPRDVRTIRPERHGRRHEQFVFMDLGTRFSLALCNDLGRPRDSLDGWSGPRGLAALVVVLRGSPCSAALRSGEKS